MRCLKGTHPINTAAREARSRGIRRMDTDFRPIASIVTPSEGFVMDDSKAQQVSDDPSPSVSDDTDSRSSCRRFVLVAFAAILGYGTVADAEAAALRVFPSATDLSLNVSISIPCLLRLLKALTRRARGIADAEAAALRVFPSATDLSRLDFDPLPVAPTQGTNSQGQGNGTCAQGTPGDNGGDPGESGSNC